MLIKNTLIAPLMFIVLFAACATGEEKVFPYSFNTAKIEYKIQGDINGTMTAYIKGDNSAKKLSGTGANNEPLSTLTIELSETIYYVDLTKNEGSSTVNPIYDDLKTLNKNEKKERLISFATNTYNSGKKPEKISTRTYAGKKCDVYSLNGAGEICLWEGIPLYSTVKMMNIERTIEATNVETGIELADSNFQLPEGVSIQDMRSQN
jgi:hypothetical protein